VSLDAWLLLANMSDETREAVFDLAEASGIDLMAEPDEDDQ
jgi:hypothetical protein